MRRNISLSLFLFFFFFTSAFGAYNVTYDRRSLIIDGERKLLISTSIHYPRSVPAVSFTSVEVFLFGWVRIWMFFWVLLVAGKMSDGIMENAVLCSYFGGVAWFPLSKFC